jgi:hypothetical protein
MWRLVLLSVTVLALAGTTLAETYVVNPEGTGDFPTIQAAVDAASDGDTIELTDGIFTGEGNRDIEYLGKAVSICSQSGNPTTCMIDCQGTFSDPHRGFHFRSGESHDSLLDGITIQGGQAPVDGPFEGSFGGGIYCDRASPTIANCVFRDNSSERGAAVFCWDEASPQVIACEFLGNVASESGGACTIYDSSPTFDGCTFEANEGRTVGAIVIGIGSVSFTDCGFFGHTGTLSSVMWAIQASVNLCRCVVRGNPGSSPFSAIEWTSCEAVTLEECTLAANAGAAMSSRGSQISVRSCTFFANEGPALLCGQTSPLLLENTIIAFSTEGPSIECDAPDPPLLSCCDIFGNAAGDWVGCIEDQYGIDGNISEDPLFCDPDNGDFTLECTSPCAPFSPPNPECDLIGAWPVGCGGTPTTRSTWGGVKALFRR